MPIADLRILAQDAEGAGAYRKLADCMRQAVIGLAVRRPLAARIPPNGAEPLSPREADPDQEKHHREAHKERRRAPRAGDRAKG